MKAKKLNFEAIFLRFLLTLLVLAIGSCTYKAHIKEPDTWELNVKPDAVFWHEGKSFSYMVQQGQTVSIRRVWSGNAASSSVSLEFGEPYIHCSYKRWISTYGQCTITIPNLDYLQTADWNHGKFGSGSTQRIH